MRISDWSSDVCSSDLEVLERRVFVAPLIGIGQGAVQGLFQIGGEHRGGLLLFQGALQRVLVAARKIYHLGDRTSVVEGKSVSVRVDLGGRRIIKQKTNTNNTEIEQNVNTIQDT